MSDNPSAPLMEIDDPAVAEAVVAWLAAHDIPAEVRDGDVTESSGINAISGAPTTRQVWLLDASHRDRAIDIIEAEARRLREPEEIPEYDIALICERCNKQMIFSSKLRGTVQECPACAEYVDIPDEEEDDFDYGVPEDEDA